MGAVHSMFPSSRQWPLVLKIIVSIKTYLVTDYGELLIVQNIVRNGSLGSKIVFEKEVILKKTSGLKPFLRHLKANIYWDTPTENTGLWQLLNESSAFKTSFKTYCISSAPSLASILSSLICIQGAETPWYSYSDESFLWNTCLSMVTRGRTNCLLAAGSSFKMERKKRTSLGSVSHI